MQTRPVESMTVNFHVPPEGTSSGESVVIPETTGSSAAVSIRNPIARLAARTRAVDWQSLLGKISAQRRKFITVLLAGVSLGMLLTIWYFATKYKVDAFIRFTNIPPPAAVFESGFKLLQSSRFRTSIGISIQRIFAGFAIAAVLGIVLGMLIGRFRLVRNLLFPAIEVLRPIPAIAWVPMSIMLWPTNEVSIVFITFLGSFFPILLNTVHGVESLDQVLLRAARSLGAKRLVLFWYVMLPGALPHVFTGLAVGMGVAWVSLIAAEMISGQFGIGYFTWEAYSLVNYAEIAFGMIVIGVLGLLCSGLIRLAGRLLMPWLALRTAETRS